MLKRHASTPSLSPLPRWGSLESGLCLWRLAVSNIARHSRIAGALDVDPRDFLVKKLQTRFTIAAKA